MSVRLNPSGQPLSGRVLLPYSKSIYNRHLLLSALGGMPHEVKAADPAVSRDSQLLSTALQSLLKGEELIDVADAGTAMRFMTAACAITPGHWHLRGSERMHERPIGPLVQALRELGAAIDYQGREGCPPLTISGGRISGNEVTIDGSTSSQYISALLMIGSFLADGLRVTLSGSITSRPYIDMTLGCMAARGLRYHRIGERHIKVDSQTDIGLMPKIERDWSAAAFIYGLCALTPGSVVDLPGLPTDSLQGDVKSIELFSRLGVMTEASEGGVRIIHCDHIAEPFIADLLETPDLAQVLAILCAAKGIECHLCGLGTLRHKETDRSAALVTELAKVGITAEAGAQHLYFAAQEARPKGVHFEVYDDHRMAMALSLFGCVAPIEISDEQVVAKSYPDYFGQLANLGFAIETVEDRGE